MRQASRMAKNMGHLLLLGIIFSSASNVAAQVLPVSVMGLSSGQGKGFAAHSSPTAIFQSSGKYGVFLFTEIPFGLIELQSSWFQSTFVGSTWAGGIGFSMSGFDQLKNRSVAFSLAKTMADSRYIGATIGVIMTQPGVLQAIYIPFWTVAFDLPIIHSLVGTFAIRKTGNRDQGILSPTKISLGGRIKIAEKVSLSSMFNISKDYPPSLETEISFQLVGALHFMAGYESGRSMFFGSIALPSHYVSASIHASWHPFLGISSGILVALTF